MSSVDKRVVQLDFDNAKFEEKASITLRTLEDMKKGFQFKDASTGLEGISAKAGSVNLNPLLTAAETVNRRFSVMGTFTSRIIENIADSAYEAGKKIAGYIAAPVTKAVNQIKTGGWTRAANLEQAKFTMENLGEDWEKWKDSINKGVAGTAFGLDQGAMLASKLIASGLKDTKDMEMALLATAGTASTFSADYERVGDILQDCISKGVAMGGEFQRLSEIGVPAAEILAEKWGVTSAEIQDMASKRQIDGMQLVAALFDKFGDSADKANKTYTGALANLNAGLSKIGELLATPLREHMRDLFNTLRVAVNTVKDLLGPIVNVVTDKMDKVFTWIIEKLGGPDEEAIRQKWSKIETALANVADALENLWNAAMSVITPIAEAFKEVFPPATIWGLTRGTKKFADLTETLIASEGTQKKIKNVFLAIFGAIRKVWGIAKKIISFIKPALKTAWSWLSKIFTTVTDLIASVQQGGFAALFDNIKSMFDGAGKAAGEAGKGLLSFLDTVPSFKQAIGIFKKFGETIADIAPTIAKVVLAVPYGIGKLLGFLIDTFAPMLGTDFSKLWVDIKDGFTQLVSFITGETKSIDVAGILGRIGQDALNVISDIGAAAIKAVTSFWEWLQNLPIDWKAVGKTISDIVSGILTGIATAISSITIDFSPILDTITNNPVVKAVATFFDKLFQATNSIKKTNKMQKAAMDGGAMIKGTAEQVADDTQDSIGILETILNGLTVAKDGALTVLLAALARVAWGVGKIVSQTGGVIKGVKKIFYSVAKENRAVARSINANALIKVAVAIGIFAAAIFALCMLPIAKVETVGGILLKFAGILAVIMTVLSVKKKADSLGFLEKLGYQIDKFFDFIKKLSAIGILVAGVGAGLYLIVRTIMLVAGIDWKKTWGAAVGVAAMLAAIAVLAWKLSDAAPNLDKGTALTIVAIGAAIRILVGAIKSLGKMLKVDKNGNIKGSSVAQLIAGVGGVSALLIAIGVMARIAKKNDIEGAGKAILAMSVGIYVLVRAVKTLSAIPFWNLVKGLAAVVGLLAVFTTVAGYFAKNDINAFAQLGKLALGIVAVTAAFYLLGVALKSIVKLAGGDMAIMGGVAAALIVFVGALAWIGNKWKSGGVAVLELAGGVLLIAAAIWVLVDAVSAAAAVPWDNLGQGIGVCAGALVALITVGALLVKFAPAIAAAGGEMLPFALSCFLIAASVWLVVDALDTLLTSPAFEGLRQKIGELIGWFKDLAKQAQEAWAWAFSGEGADQIEQQNAANTNAIDTYLDTQDKMNKGLIKKNDALLESLRVNAEAAAKDLGFNSVAGYVEALSVNVPTVCDAAANVMSEAEGAAKKEAGIHSPSTIWEAIGDACIAGLTKAFEESDSMVGKAASSLMGVISNNAEESTDLTGGVSEELNSLTEMLSGGDAKGAAGILGDLISGEYGDHLNLSGLTEVDLNDMISTLTEKYPELAEACKELGGGMGSSILEEWGLQNVGEEIATSTAQTVRDTVSGNLISFEKVSDDIASTLADGFEAGGPLLQSAALTDVDYIQDGLIGEDALGKISDGANSLIGSALTTIDDKGSDFYDAGVNAAEGFRLGFVSKIPEWVQTAANGCNAMLTSVDNTLAIASPSKEMKKRGKYALEGFEEGLNDHMPITGLKDWMDMLSIKAAKSFGLISSDIMPEDVYDKLKREQREHALDGAKTFITEFIKAYLANRTLLGKVGTEVVSNVAGHVKDAISEHTAAFKLAGSLALDAVGDGISEKLEPVKNKAKLASTILNSSFVEGLTGTTAHELLTKAAGSVAYKAGEVIRDATVDYKNDVVASSLATVGYYVEGFKEDSIKKAMASFGVDPVGTVLRSIYDFTIQPFVDAGSWIINGLVSGLQSGLTTLSNAAIGIGNTVLNTLGKMFMWGSPSRVMIQRGQWITEGILIGLTKDSDKLTSEAGEMATGILAALSTITLDDTTLNPTITPIMDLSNLQNGADTINGMFANTTLGVGGIQGDIFGGNLRNLAALAGSLSMDRGTGSADVVNAITALQDEVATMGEKMSKLQVRMDSGALVGQIAAPLDASLGRIARRRERSG